MKPPTVKAGLGVAGFEGIGVLAKEYCGLSPVSVGGTFDVFTVLDGGRVAEAPGPPDGAEVTQVEAGKAAVGRAPAPGWDVGLFWVEEGP